ncbi:MAG: Gfo/Idh/MocA family oxidoreductase [bacterium]
MKKNKIGVCIIGAGRAGMIHARNFAGGVPNAQLVAIADPSRESLERASEELGITTCYPDYHSALSNDAVDAVVIATPTIYHEEIAVASANAGKHILCEKPMAMNPNECDRMIRAAEDNKVKLQIGFMRRFDESFISAKESIKRGDIGDVVLVKSLTRGPSTPQRWQYDIEKSNGTLAEVNSHDIDTLRWFTESEFREVYAIAGNFRCPDAKDEFPDFYDNVIMIASFVNGMQGYIDGAASVRYGYDARVEILGTEGVIFLGQLHEGSVVVCNRDSGAVKPIVKSWRNLFKDAYLAEDRDFVECILEDRTPRATGLDGKMATAVVNAGNRSIKERKPIPLTY